MGIKEHISKFLSGGKAKFVVARDEASEMTAMVLKKLYKELGTQKWELLKNGDFSLIKHLFKVFRKQREV